MNTGEKNRELEKSIADLVADMDSDIGEVEIEVSHCGEKLQRVTLQRTARGWEVIKIKGRAEISK